MVYTLAILLFCVVNGLSAQRESWYQKLKDELFVNRRYDQQVIPLEKLGQTVQLSVGLSLIKISELDMHHETLKIAGWLNLKWKDSRLTWSEEQFGGISVLRIPSEAVWSPDISLYNGIGKDVLVQDIHGPYSSNKLVYPDGSIVWIPPVRMESHCKLNLAAYPYDTQRCSAKLGSWVYDGTILNLTISEGIDTKDFQSGAEWTVTKTSIERQENFYPCCIEGYPSIHFNLTLERNSAFAAYTVVAPTTVSILLTLGMFWVGVRAKAIFGGLSLAISLTLLVVLGCKIGVASSVPVIVRVLGINILLTGISLIVIGIVENITRRRSSDSLVGDSAPKYSPELFSNRFARILVGHHSEDQWDAVGKSVNKILFVASLVTLTVALFV